MGNTIVPHKTCQVGQAYELPKIVFFANIPSRSQHSIVIKYNVHRVK